METAKYMTSIRLSRYIWELKEKNMKIAVKWEIINKTVSYRKKKSKFYRLCLEEKLTVILYEDPQEHAEQGI